MCVACVQTIPVPRPTVARSTQKREVDWRIESTTTTAAVSVAASKGKFTKERCVGVYRNRTTSYPYFMCVGARIRYILQKAGYNSCRAHTEPDTFRVSSLPTHLYASSCHARSLGISYSSSYLQIHARMRPLRLAPAGQAAAGVAPCLPQPTTLQLTSPEHPRQLQSLLVQHPVRFLMTR